MQPWIGTPTAVFGVLDGITVSFRPTSTDALVHQIPLLETLNSEIWLGALHLSIRGDNVAYQSNLVATYLDISQWGASKLVPGEPLWGVVFSYHRAHTG